MFHIISGYTGVKKPKGSKTQTDHTALFQIKKNKHQSLGSPKQDKQK